MPDKSRLLFWSNAPNTTSGYGRVMSLTAPRTLARGYPTAVFGNHGAKGFSYKHNGVLVLPSYVDLYGNDMIHGHMKTTKSDLLIVCYDPQTIDYTAIGRYNTIFWTPILEQPLFIPVSDVLEYAQWIWSYSKFGVDVLTDAGFAKDVVDYVPLSVDTNVFKPINKEVAKTAMSSRLKVDLNSTFFIVMNCANTSAPSRKGFFEALQAFKLFSEKYDAVLYIHTEPQGLAGGIDLPSFIRGMEIDPMRIYFPDVYNYVCGNYLDPYLATMYNAADCLLHTAHAEGCGLPLLEAQACGTPVVCTDGSSMTEHVGAGCLIEADKYMLQPGVYWWRPKIDALVAGLETVYKLSKQEQHDAAERARQFALDFDVETVMNKYFMPALEKVEALINVKTIPDKIEYRRAGVMVP